MIVLIETNYTIISIFTTKNLLLRQETTKNIRLRWYN